MKLLKSVATVVGVLIAATTVQAQENRLTLGNKSDSLELKGDLRIRYERIETEQSGSADQSLDRFRTRFRLGMKFATEWGWDVAAGLATGGASATSTNDTWSDFTPPNSYSTFETGDIRLDYAYATHKFGDSTKVTLGQQKIPFKNGGILWDSDVRPAGFAANHMFGPAFVTAAYFNSSYSGSASSLGELYAVQGGITQKGDVSYTAAGTYYGWNTQAAEDNYATNTEEELKVLAAYGDLGYKVDDSTALKLWAEYSVNTGADSDLAKDNDTAMTIGGQVKMSKVKLSAMYYSTEAASTYAGIVDADSQGVNWEGFRLKAGYNITQNFSAGLFAQFSEEIEAANPEEKTTYQVDMVYKF